jgi:hypothetical protein
LSSLSLRNYVFSIERSKSKSSQLAVQPLLDHLTKALRGSTMLRFAFRLLRLLQGVILINIIVDQDS